MSKRTVFIMLCVTIFILVPISAQAEPPHDASNGINCTDCHKFTYQGGMLRINVPRGEEQETVCKSCHSPGGQAASMSSVGNHVVNGDSIIDCGSCHDPHTPNMATDPHTDVEALNLRLIRKETRHVDGALDLAIFQQSPAHFAFAGDNEPWNGICQTCHTGTSHHTNDDTGDHDHEVGPESNCIDCHSHEDGFVASGGSCTGCHSNPQGGRRAVVTEFPVDNTHAHYGADLDGSCEVCHSMGTHMDGYVELVDPDDGSIYRFQSPGDLTSDPDLSTFCSGCHDADGAQHLAAPFDPFGNGNAPPDVATRFLGTLQWDEWYGDFCFGYEGTMRQVNSHHDISDADQAWSGAKIECLNCHGAHNASADTPIADPSNQAVAWTGTMNDFCLTCHAGSNGPLDPSFPLGILGLDVFVPMMDPTCNPNPDYGCYGTGELCSVNSDCPDFSPMRGLDTGDCSYNVQPYWVNYTWTHVPHGLDSKRYWAGYPNLPGSDAVLDCTVCHDPHGSYTATNTLGNPYMIRDFVDGTQFIDDGNRPDDPSTWNAKPGTAGSVVVTINGTAVDWGSNQSLCIKCHATWLDAYSWHDYCDGCMTCHGHGQSWDGYDWGPGNDDDTSCYEEQEGASSPSLQPGKLGVTGIKASEALPTRHQEMPEQSCSECHVPHN